MSFEGLQERLLKLQETTSSIKALIQRLATLQFQPGSVPLDTSYYFDEGENDDEDGEGNVMTELGDEIKQSLKEQEDDLEMLQLDIEYLPPGRPGSEVEIRRAALKEDARAAEKDIKGAWAHYRRALLSAHQNLKEAQIAERKLLLASMVNPPAPPSASTSDPNASTDSLPTLLLRQRRDGIRTPSGQQSKTTHSKEVSASQDITSALRRTHNLLSSELSRSQFAHDTLRESTAALTQLHESYSSLDSLLRSSRTLVGSLLKSQKSDTWYLETAFWVLVATIAWLVFRRWVYGPAWWLIWIPLRLALKAFYMAWMGVFTAVGLRGGREGVFGAPDVDVGGTAVIMSPPAGSVGVSGSVGMVGGSVPTMSITEDEAEKQKGKEEEKDDSMVEEVGKIIDESRNGQQPVQQEQDAAAAAAAQKNPKKRMWEEDKEAKKYEEQKAKDEL